MAQPIYRSADVRRIEVAAHDQPLMERAGLAAAKVAQAMVGERGGSVLVLAGPGNNGGDAFVVARWMRAWFHEVVVVFIGDATKLPVDAAAAHRAFTQAGGVCVTAIPERWRGALIVDGLFGIGLTRPLAAEYAALVEQVNALNAPVLALDVPSGLVADTGVALEPAIRATATATFIALKPGLVTGAGIDACGDVSVHALDLDVEALLAPRGRTLAWASLAAALPDVLARRLRDVHKGTFGTLAVIGGADGMLGAPLLAARAGQRLGAGKVYVGFLAHDPPRVDWAAPELMLRMATPALAADIDAVVVGPGLGNEANAALTALRAFERDAPLVADADALNLAAAQAPLASALADRPAATILTPHPAEAARLLAVSTADVQRDRLAAAQTLAQKFNAHVVLKGAGSVLAHPDGDWDINASGNPALASGGSGDVLSGMIGALLAQGLDAKTALRYGVCLHGAAADALVAKGEGPLGLAASDLADAARDLVNAAAQRLD